MGAAETAVTVVVGVCVAEFNCRSATLEDKNGRVYGMEFTSGQRNSKRALEWVLLGLTEKEVGFGASAGTILAKGRPWQDVKHSYNGTTDFVCHVGMLVQ